MSLDPTALLAGIGGNGANTLDADFESAPTVEPEAVTPAIDKLGKDDDLHKSVLDYLTDRLRFSEQEMENFYSRWSANEIRMQAYISHPKWEDDLRAESDVGKIPNVVRIVVPFGYAALSTITTFMIHTFTGRRPMFQVGSYSDEGVDPARNMEELLQYNADRTRLVKYLWQFFNDIGIYGVGILKTDWLIEEKLRTTRQGGVITRELQTVYEGNDVVSVDPFMFFPDPRVPMSEVNRRGEFAFWRAFESILFVKDREAEGDYKFTDKINAGLPGNERTDGSRSSRSALARGRAIPALDTVRGHAGGKAKDFVQLDQGVVRIIPRDLKLSDSDRMELWIFTIANKNRIVQAEKYDEDHGMIPLAIAEPYGFGYGFGQPGPADFISPIQDMTSWLMNSHIENVRMTLNTTLVVDPSRIVMKDLERAGPGKRIRLKPNALGSDVREAIHQLQIVDATQGHLRDAELMMKLGELILGISSTATGRVNAGGRKTATEIRQAGEGAVSRMAAVSTVTSAQAIVDMTEQMTMNIQQHLSPEFKIKILGSQGERIELAASNVEGQFMFPLHDGALPLDRVALAQVWQQIVQAMLGDEALRQSYDVGKAFEHAAELAGAKNIESFRLKQGPVQSPAEVGVQSPEQIESGIQNNTLAPLLGGGR